MFRKYDHVERLGHDEVNGLTIGDTWVFAKLDGTNASVWLDGPITDPESKVCAGSRTRMLSAEQDNAGFYRYVADMEAVFKELLVQRFPECHIYGEWLVPHTLKTYREDAWRKFYVFDLYDRTQNRYLAYEEFAEEIARYGLDLIEPLCQITNPSDEQLNREAENNTYLILDGAGVGEGIVVKNYSWKNRFGRQPWAKIVRNEFKEENKRQFGTTKKGGTFQVEAAMVEEFLTAALVEKTKMKILFALYEEDIDAGVEERPDADVVEEGYRRVQERHRGQVIPRLLGTVFHEFIQEELWMALKRHKFPVVDFKKLRAHAILQTKKHASELF
jgi:hypothetical protein